MALPNLVLFQREVSWADIYGGFRVTRAR